MYLNDLLCQYRKTKTFTKELLDEKSVLYVKLCQVGTIIIFAFSI